MLEALQFSNFESSLKKKEGAAAGFTLSTTCSALKPKWLAKIADNRQHISHLMQEIREEEASSPPHSPIREENTNAVASLAVLDRLQIHQKNLLNAISNVSLQLLSDPSPSEQEANHPTQQPIKENQLIHCLKKKGYIALAQKLDSQSGYPWNEIKMIRSPLLIEQLVDLYLLCCHQYSNDTNPNTDAFMGFALNLAQLATAPNFKNQYSRSAELIDDAKQILGQLIYLVNRDHQLALKAISHPHYNQVIENLSREFNIAIQEICHRLQDHYVNHYETQLQSPDIALYTLIPVEIAKALLTDIGTINVGIIDILSDIFLSPEERHIDHEANLSYALKLLQRSPKLRSEFEKIHCPRSLKMPSNDVIRASLTLSPSVPINDLQARLTALIALLSHLRQGEEGSCFAVSLAIEILSAHLGFCLKDLRQLLHESKLTRHVKNISKDIPFVKRIHDENINKVIQFDQTGYLLIQGERRAALWEAPGIQAICTAIDLKNCKESVLAAIKDIPLKEDKLCHEISIKQLIEKLCERAHAERKELSLGELFAQACFAFSSQTSQPLLKIWENAIASMAEAEEGSMIKTAILKSVLDTLQFKLGELRIPPTRLLQRFFLSIQKQLYDSIRLRYDPAIQGKWGEDFHPKTGGFVLYQDNRRIDSAAAFRNFILDMLFNTTKQLKHKELSDTETKELNDVLDIFIPYIDSKDFLGHLLVRYHPSNRLAVAQLSAATAPDYGSLEFTPWLTQTGNNSRAVLKVYLETDKPFATEQFVSDGAEEALTNIIEMCKRMSEEEKRQFLDNPNKLKPFCILGKHRLPFMAGSASLANAWQQDCPTKQWIQHDVLNPGEEIANSEVDPITKKNLLESIQKDILPTFSSKEETNKCLTFIQQIPEPIKMKDYRKMILEICKKMYTTQALNLGKLARQIDTALCQSLEPALKKKLEDSAVHFADTNWCSGIHDIHFCFAVNPGTGKLELWEAYSNGSHLVALDQNYWLFNQKWEFLTIPDELIPDDGSTLSSAPRQ